MGFSVPLAASLRGSLMAPVQGALAAPAFADAGLFDPAEAARLLAQHRSGRRDHSRIIWALFMFAGFLAQVHGQAAPLSAVDDALGQRVPDAEPWRRLA
jgi:asparagine synthase (glutamine-hydrolysing)